MRTLKRAQEILKEKINSIGRMKYIHANSYWLTHQEIRDALGEAIQMLDESAVETQMKLEVAILMKEIEGETHE